MGALKQAAAHAATRAYGLVQERGAMSIRELVRQVPETSKSSIVRAANELTERGVLEKQPGSYRWSMVDGASMPVDCMGVEELRGVAEVARELIELLVASELQGLLGFAFVAAGRPAAEAAAMLVRGPAQGPAAACLPYKAPGCTELAASSCPRCGECSCSDEGVWPLRSRGCPLHGDTSEHRRGAL